MDMRFVMFNYHGCEIASWESEQDFIYDLTHGMVEFADGDTIKVIDKECE